jgi:hypothetical protein
VRHIHWLVSGAAAFCTFAAAAGCAESSAPDNPGSSSSGGSGSTLASSGGAGGEGTGGEGGGKLCVVSTKKAEAVALDLLVLMDRSESMNHGGRPLPRASASGSSSTPP